LARHLRCLLVWLFKLSAAVRAHGGAFAGWSGSTSPRASPIGAATPTARDTEFSGGNSRWQSSLVLFGCRRKEQPRGHVTRLSDCVTVRQTGALPRRDGAADGDRLQRSSLLLLRGANCFRKRRVEFFYCLRNCAEKFCLRAVMAIAEDERIRGTPFSSAGYFVAPPA